MSPKSLSRNPEASHELTWINEVIGQIKALLGKAMTPNIEEWLRKLTEPTLKMLETLLNPNTNGTKELMLSRLMSVLNK